MLIIVSVAQLTLSSTVTDPVEENSNMVVMGMLAIPNIASSAVDIIVQFGFDLSGMGKIF